MSISDIYHLLRDPEQIIQTGGLILILLIIFTENGVFFGCLLPGDTLLFTAGLLCSTGHFEVSIYLLLVSISAAAFLGSSFGYYFGKRAGRTLLNRKENFFYKRKYMDSAQAFFERHGGFALIMGRFLPIIRTFAPIFAGMTNFDYPKFVYYNILGGTIWVFLMLLAGYFLGLFIPESAAYIEYLILGIVIITWIPVIITYFKERKRLQK
ncbi:MAG: dedA [Chitinophagaceae bacterium]|nr:dedA [Chitinophagaceae bacterium]